jgi:ParB family chromosome partitioning protein
LLAAIQPRHLSAALRKRHNWGEDFERRPKPLLLEAVAEAFGKDEAARVGSLPRDKLTAWCKVNIPPTGWLPPELRFPGFALPGAKKPAATKPAAKTSAPKKAVKKKGKR